MASRDLFNEEASASSITKADAALILRNVWDQRDSIKPAPHWRERINHLSQLCVDSLGRTHIAMLGTAILAKAVDPDVDLYAFKPKHAGTQDRAYSARSLCHGVLVPMAAELGFHLGATGREPLNNQPYFRMKRLNDGTPIHGRSREAFDYMMALVQELSTIQSPAALRSILASYLQVREKYQPRYAPRQGQAVITPYELVAALQQFVSRDSEGGKRAQASVAGLFDVFSGPENVESGRINDPSREYPGDVCIRAIGRPMGNPVWAKAVEVRDKPVSMSDVKIFGKRCADFGVREAAVVMVSDQQPSLDHQALSAWANGYGIGLTLFQGWPSFVDQVLYWSDQPKPDAAAEAVTRIHDRLIAVEVTVEGLELWHALTSNGH